MAESEDCALLKQQLAESREAAQKLIQQTEAEEDMMANKLNIKLDELKKEKERLMVQVEEEEEYLTNTLQRKLQEMRQEKIDLENELEQEEEFLTNRLQKQLEALQAERDALAAKVELHDEQMTKMEQQLESYKEQNKQFRAKVQKLNTENFVLKQRMESEKELLHELKMESARKENEVERTSEREFNTQKRGSNKRVRSVSMPVGGKPIVAKKPRSPIRRPDSDSKLPSNTGPVPTSPVRIAAPLMATSPLGSSPVSGFLTQPQFQSGFGSNSSVKRGFMRLAHDGNHWAQCMFVLRDTGELMCCDSESGVTIRINLDTVEHMEEVSKKMDEESSMPLPHNTMEVVTTSSTFRFSCDKRKDFDEWYELIKDLSPICK